MGASFEEKSVWIQLVGTVIGLGAYFLIAGRMLAAGITALPAYLGVFLAAILFMVGVLVVGHIVAAIVSRRNDFDSDERDRIIGWRAESNSGWVLAAGVVCALGAMVAGIELAWIANGLLASLFLSEVLGYVMRIVYYRRGMGGA